jgi:hypothetical protein
VTAQFLPVQSEPLSRLPYAETAYFRGAKHLADLYGLQAPDRGSAPYPLNVARSFTILKTQLEKHRPDLSLAIVQGTDHRISLATIKTIDPSDYTWYVPILPLYQLFGCEKARTITPLLLEMFRYLYHHMGIPHYTETRSYLYFVHETICQWLYDCAGDCDPGFQVSCLAELSKAERIGIAMFKKMRKPFNQARLESQVLHFHAATDWESDLEALGNEYVQFVRKYGKRSLYDAIPEGFLEPTIEERIAKDCYLSFSYDAQGWLEEEVVSFVDGDLQERLVIDAPLALQTFDKPQITESHDLQFETAAFSLIDNLHRLLYHLNHEEYNALV